MIYNNVSDMILDDVFLRLDDFVPGCEVLLKIEWFNGAGSIKLKTAVSLVADAQRRGLRSGDAVIESSSGNLGVALAAVCAHHGYRFVCVTDPNASAHSIALMRALGARVIVVDQRDSNGGYLDTRIQLIHRLLAEDPHLVWTNQYANLANPDAHRRRTAQAIHELGGVDELYIGAGTTGTLRGCAQYLRKHDPHVRLIAVDSVGSVTFGHPAGPRHIPGLGTSRRPELFRTDVFDEIELVSESVALKVCRDVATGYGIVVGGSTGSVLAAVRRRAATLPPGSRVVAVSPDSGERYLSTVYDDAWVGERFGAFVAALGGGA